MNIFSNIIANIKDFLNKKNIEDANKKAKELAIAQEILSQGKSPAVGPYIEHPLHKARLVQYTKNIDNYSKIKNRPTKTTVAFGDSILDIPRGDYKAIDEKLNFAISGSWANHMQQMATDISNLLYQKGVTVNYVIVGTLGGNPLLSYQYCDATVKISWDCLDKIRNLFPFAKIIVFGLPPVYNIWATINSIKFESRMYEWVHNDNNAVFVPIFSKFGKGLFNLTPDLDTSKDGVHLTAEGVVILDNLFTKAKSAKPKSIID